MALPAPAAVSILSLGGRTPPLPPIPLVDPQFTNATTVRRSYADLAPAKEDRTDFDRYGCPERKRPLPLRFDAQLNLILPKAHRHIVLSHGRHDRMNHQNPLSS